MRVLIAPDKFKHALTAREAADAMRLGVLDAAPDALIELCPMADGGEGSGELLAAATSATRRTQRVLDPLARPIDARWWLGDDACTAIVEMAEASGLQLLQQSERDPLRATSYGTGQLLAAAFDAGAREVLLCVGGSATVDGGVGAIQALGGIVCDERGNALSRPLGGGDLCDISRVDLSNIRRAAILVLSDVDNPCCGLSGAAAVYGPQKGASHSDVRTLDDSLRNWLRVLCTATGRDVADMPGGGAAGGIVAGLAAALEARRVSGFDEIARRVGLADRIAASDIVLTGEGRLDAQSTRGKVVGGVARLAHQAGKPVFAIVGQLDGSRDELVRAMGLTSIEIATPPDCPWDDARRHAVEYVRRAAARQIALFDRR
ncbi:MAG: glycerate kinase [Phycisphaerae bacterium]